MNLKIITLVIFVLVPLAALFAQTKKIAHRSHSGKNVAITANMPGNLGLVAEDVFYYDSVRKEKMRQDSIAKRHMADSLKKSKPGKKDSLKKADTARKSTVPVYKNQRKKEVILPASSGINNGGSGRVAWLGVIVFASAFVIALLLLFKKKTQLT